MAPSENIDSILRDLPSLTEMLDGEYTTMALVCCDGTWYAEQNAAVRLQKPILPPESCEKLVDFLIARGPLPLGDDWWIRTVCARRPSTVIFERRPTVEPDSISPHTLELLRARLEPDTSGVVFGTSPQARTQLLLSLIPHLPPGLVCYVGPTPPAESNDGRLLHIPPPRDDGDRRHLASIFERASAVLFDGPVSPSDLRLLLAGSHRSHRWVAIDAADPDFWISSTIESIGDPPPIDTKIGVQASAAGKIGVEYFAIRHHRDWDVLLDVTEDGDTEGAEEEITKAYAHRLSAQLTSPIDHRNDSSRDDNSDDNPAPEVNEESHPEESGFDIAALMEEDEDEAILRESGEIDVPGFVSKQQQRSRDASKSNPDPTDALRGEKIDDELPGLVAASDIDAVEIPELDPEQLRQTYDGPVDVESMARADSSAADIPPPAVDTAPSPKDEEIDDDPETKPIEINESEAARAEDSPPSDAGSDDPSPPSSSTDSSLRLSNSKTTGSRSLRRTSQLGTEISSGRLNSDRSTTDNRKKPRSRRDTSGRRVLPVPSSRRRRRDADTTTTRDISPTGSDDAEGKSPSNEASPAQTPEPITVQPDDTSESTVELDVADELNTLDEDSSDTSSP